MADDERDGTKLVSVPIPSEETLKIVNAVPQSQLVTFDCGVFGIVSFTLPIGASFEFTPRSVMPDVTRSTVHLRTLLMVIMSSESTRKIDTRFPR